MNAGTEAGAVGLVGCGLLGSAIGARLSDAGYAVVVHDVDAARAGIVREFGGEFCGRLERIGELARRIVLSLPDSTVVRAVLRDLSATLQAGTLIIDTTTGDPNEMEHFADVLGKQGVGYVDATVGGSSALARRGEVIVMAGGSATDLADARPLLDSFARRVFPMGPSGSGARMKLVLNLVLGLNRAALAEGLAFADACGLEGQAVLEVLQAGPAASVVMETKGLKMLSADYEPEARLAQHLKDVNLILAFASINGQSLPFSELHRELLGILVQRGFGDLDNSAVREAFRAAPGGEG